MKIACLRAHPVTDSRSQKGAWRVTLTPFLSVMELYSEVALRAKPGRLSLLYPLAPASIRLPTEGSSYCLTIIGALTPLEAYTAISHTEALSRSLASLGAGCLIVWSSERDDNAEWYLRVEEELEGRLTFVERWEIDAQGMLQSVTSTPFGAQKEVSFPSLPANLREHRSQTTIDEAGYHGAMLESYSTWFYPELSEEFALIHSKLSGAVNLLSELCEDSLEPRSDNPEIKTEESRTSLAPPQDQANCQSAPPAAIQTESLEPVAAGAAQLQCRRDADFHLSCLIELTSGLAYASSQALSGISPILENRGLLYPHTLLGANAAWRAINSACQEVFATLREVNFPEKVRERLTGEAPEQTKERPTLAPRVVHFSGRHGFGETETAITYPTQALSHCVSANWTLTTVTHEALHSEVRLLLSSVFAFRVEDKLLKFPECLLEVAGRYLKKIAPLKGKAALQKIQELENPQERLAFEFLWRSLTFAEAFTKAASRHSRQAGEKPEQFDSVLPKNPIRFIQRIRIALKVFEEFFVHTLDLEYFYGGKTELFSKAIWASWSMIPSVASNFDMYLLRTLAVIGGYYQGGDYDRLRDAKRDLSRSLEELISIQPTNEVLRHARNVLLQEQGPEKTWIDRLFPESVRFVDVIRKELVSPELKNKFTETCEELGIGDCILGEFVSPRPPSVLSLLRSNRYSELGAGGIERDRLSELRDSAWLLLAAASAQTRTIPQ